VLKHCAILALPCLLATGTANAGLYNLSEPLPLPQIVESRFQPLHPRQFSEELARLLQVGLEKINNKVPQSREHYLAQREKLQARLRAGSITIPERIDLSAYLVRLREAEQAVDVLTPAAAQDRRNFMIFANLGTAHQQAGRLDRALSYLELVRDVWPTDFPGLSREQLAWFREAEKLHLRLVRLRFREAARGQRTASEPDDLFAGVRWVGEGGKYEAGKLAAAERAKLPPDALALVQQLVLWLPDDTRLYWLLGELYNATGDVETAARIFEECVWSRRYDAAELRAHRQVVQEARPKRESALVGVTDMAPPEPTAPGPSPGWLPDAQHLWIVGGLAGLVILLLIYLQVREVRRRRRARLF
jgi:tetratricopeptide (TPR) repeat protein